MKKLIEGKVKEKRKMGQKGESLIGMKIGKIGKINKV
jgi:hypothetical protein